MTRQEMIKKIEAIRDLPTLPMVPLAVNRMLKDEAAPIEALIELLEKDQSIVLKLLRLVNSSFYGFKSKVASLRHAITLLGYSTVQNAVVTLSVIDCLNTQQTPKDFDISQFWTHSIAVAVMGRHLAQKLKLPSPDEAFTAGLVHDIGKVVLASHFPSAFLELLHSASAEAITFYGAERQSDTYPHTRIGSLLAKRWMLPETLVTAIRCHHSSHPGAGDATLPGVVAAADTLINVMHKTPGHHFSLEALQEAVRAPLTAVLKDCAHWYPQVEAEVAAACEFFNKG